MLVDAGALEEETLEGALQHQRRTGTALGECLLALGLITEELVIETLAKQMGLPAYDLRELEIPADVQLMVRLETMKTSPPRRCALY